MICVSCGKEVAQPLDGECASCYAEKHSLLHCREVMDLEFCAHCSARHVGAHWMEAPEGTPRFAQREEAVLDILQVHEAVEGVDVQLDEHEQTERHHKYHIVMRGELGGVAVVETAEILVRSRNGVCDRCSRLAGDYWAAIIQMRASERHVSAAEMATSHNIVATELERQRANGNRFSFLTKGGPMHGGHDYYIGDIEAARAVCRVLKPRLGATVQESAKLVGRREGEDVYRVTFLVRIQLFAPHDIALLPTGKLLVVHSAQKGRIIGQDLETHLKTRVPETGVRRLGGFDLHEQAIVVSHQGKHLQIMDPQTYQTVDLNVPEGYTPGEEVTVIRHEERLYLIPQSNNP